MHSYCVVGQLWSFFCTYIYVEHCMFSLQLISCLSWNWNWCVDCFLQW